MKKYKIYWQKCTNQGYTLVELLTVIGILSVIGAMVVSVVFITVRGTKKSDTTEMLRQNGDAALTQMVRSVRFAKSLDAPVSCTTPITSAAITITSLASNTQTTFSCSGNTISSNSASLFNTNAVSVSSCSFVCSQSSLNEPPTITIQFLLKPVTTGNFAETSGSIPFQSSVTLRNYNR